MKKFLKNLMRNPPCTCKKCNSEFSQKDMVKYISCNEDYVEEIRSIICYKKSPFCPTCLVELSTYCASCGKAIFFGENICLIETSKLKTKKSSLSTYTYVLNKKTPKEIKIECSVLCLSHSCNETMEPNYPFPEGTIWHYDKEKMIGKPKTLNKNALYK